jgi:hypothetical protein
MDATEQVYWAKTKPCHRNGSLLYHDFLNFKSLLQSISQAIWPIYDGYFGRSCQKSCSHQNYLCPIFGGFCLAAKNITVIFSAVFA